MQLHALQHVRVEPSTAAAPASIAACASAIWYGSRLVGALAAPVEERDAPRPPAPSPRRCPRAPSSPCRPVARSGPRRRASSRWRRHRGGSMLRRRGRGSRGRRSCTPPTSTIGGRRASARVRPAPKWAIFARVQRRQRVHHALRPVVHHVVVREAHHVHAARDAAWTPVGPRAEVEVLRAACSPRVGERALEVHQEQIAPSPNSAFTSLKPQANISSRVLALRHLLVEVLLVVVAQRHVAADHQGDWARLRSGRWLHRGLCPRDTGCDAGSGRSSGRRRWRARGAQARGRRHACSEARSTRSHGAATRRIGGGNCSLRPSICAA